MIKLEYTRTSASNIMVKLNGEFAFHLTRERAGPKDDRFYQWSGTFNGRIVRHYSITGVKAAIRRLAEIDAMNARVDTGLPEAPTAPARTWTADEETAIDRSVGRVLELLATREHRGTATADLVAFLWPDNDADISAEIVRRVEE